MRKIFVLAALITGSQLSAQQTTAAKDSVQSTMDPVVITTNKFPRKQSQTGKVTTVIDRVQLDRMGSRSLGEILNTVSGTVINGANGTRGTNQRISIRGSSDGNVLLLIDGIPVNDPSVISNYFDLNFLQPDQVERIEVLKGGQSTLYGSDAVSGVINIITRKPSNAAFSPYVNLTAGSYATYTGSAGFTGRKNKVNYQLDASAQDSKGFSSAWDSTGQKDFEPDGYRQYTAQGKFGVDISQHLEWNLLGNYSWYKTDIDAAAFIDDRDFTVTNKNLQLGTGLEWKQDRGSLHLNYRYNRMNRIYLDDSTDRSSFYYYSETYYTGNTHYAEAYEHYQWKNLEFLAGIDYRYYKTNQLYKNMSGFGPYETSLPDSLAHMSQTSPYLSFVYHHQLLNVELGGRWNHHSSYGNNFTYTFNPSVLLQKKLKLFINLSSAFKTPSLFQLFDPYSGNPDLGPERSSSMEAGAELYAGQASRIRLTPFYNHTRNAILYIITDPVNFFGHYANMSEQKNYGLEAEFSHRSSHWNFTGNYSFTKGRTRSGYSESGNALAHDTSYNNLYRVPEHAARIFAGYTWKKLNVNTLLQYTGKRLEPVYGTAPKELDAYATADISAQYRFSPRFTVFLDLKNITDTKYFDVLGYTTRGFNFAAGIRIR